MSQIDAGRNSGLREVTTPLPPWKEERRKSLRREPKADYEIAAGRLLRHPARRVERHFCYEGNEPCLVLALPWKEERRKSLRRDRKADYEIAARRLLRERERSGEARERDVYY